MDKLNCIENYFTGIRAYYLYLWGVYSHNDDMKQYILDKKYINAAKVAFVSNIMLSIKEDLVDNLGARVYESKVFESELDRVVSILANKEPSGYRLGGYLFDDAPTLVAIIRNKLAHGNYIMDLEHNRIIINHKGMDIIINIDKLIIFLMEAFGASMFSVKTNVYERNFLYYDRVDVDRENRLKDIDEVSKIIKKYDYVSFKLESLDGSVIGYDCLYWLEQLIYYYKDHIKEPLDGEYYKKVNEYFKYRNCKLTVDFKKIRGYENIQHILNYSSKEILSNPVLSYRQQLNRLGAEIERCINNKYNVFNPLDANMKNIMMLSAIYKMNSVRDETLSDYVYKVYGRDIYFGYDEFAMTVMGMINALFVYPFDDVYTSVGEYKIDRSLEFDFSKLDLSMVNPVVLNVDESPLINSEERCNALIKKRDKIQEKIEEQTKNLSMVKDNSVAYAKISGGIADLQNSLALVLGEYAVSDALYNAVKQDYSDNSLYFRNRAIIEGIRNSMAHGNYEVVSNSSFDNIVVVFKNIYEGKLMFHLEISLDDMQRLIDNNYDILLSFVREKTKNQNGEFKKK